MRWPTEISPLMLGCLLIVYAGATSGEMAKNIYVWPGNFALQITREGKAGTSRDDYCSFFDKMAEACAKLGHTVFFDTSQNIVMGLAGDFDVVICFDLPISLYDASFSLWKLPNGVQTILFMWEPPTIKRWNTEICPWRLGFDNVFVLYDDIVGASIYSKFYEPQPTFESRGRAPSFAERGFVTILTGLKASWHPRELYSERVRVTNGLAGLGAHVDIYGAFGQYGDRQKNYFGEIPPSSICSSVGYCGYASSKCECYKSYKFAICYENMRGRPGYVTAEKFMFCFLGGCVPVYWGADNITDYVPPDCFIDRRNFVSDIELHKYLMNFTEDDYKKYMENIRRYIQSPWPRVFSQNNFVDILISSFDPQYERAAVFTSEEFDKLRWEKVVMKELGHLSEADGGRWRL